MTSRECNVQDPRDVARSAEGQIVLTRELFDVYVRNRAFSSWEELQAALTEKPTSRGYTGQQGQSSTVIKLDPARIFGWTAAILLQFGVGGVISYCSDTYSPFFAAVLSSAYALTVWRVLEVRYAPQVAGVLWPIVPGALAATGMLVQAGLAAHNVGSNQGDVVALFFWLLPATGLTTLLLRGAREDPDRASLVALLVAGLWGSLVVLFRALTFSDGSIFAYWVGLLLGLGTLFLGLRLFVNPGNWGSVELVSWILNIGALVLFFLTNPLFADSWLGTNDDMLVWLAFSVVIVGVGLLGSITGRSLPLLLAALGVLHWSGRLAYAAGSNASSGTAPVVAFIVVGATGVFVIFVGNWMQQSSQWAELVMTMRCSVARAFGSPDSPYTWTYASQAALTTSADTVLP